MRVCVDRTRNPKLKPATTVAAMEKAASSRSPRWPMKACVTTLIAYSAIRWKMAGATMRHSFFDSTHHSAAARLARPALVPPPAASPRGCGCSSGARAASSSMALVLRACAPSCWFAARDTSAGRSGARLRCIWSVCGLWWSPDGAWLAGSLFREKARSRTFPGGWATRSASSATCQIEELASAGAAGYPGLPGWHGSGRRGNLDSAGQAELDKAPNGLRSTAYR